MTFALSGCPVARYPMPHRRRVLALAAIIGLCVAMNWSRAQAAEGGSVLPDPAVDAKATVKGKQTAVISGGCFWGIQAVFQHVKGVKSAVSGYSGGVAATAKYEMV